MTIVCGDSHTATHGAMGALAFGIGTSEVEHVLATQTLIQAPAKNMLVEVNGALGAGVSPKDVILAIIGKIGTAGGTGHVIEYAGSTFRAMSMEGRMTVCNMSIEAGARAGLVAPDETTFAYVKGRPYAPKGEAWEQAVAYWKTLPSDPGAQYDKKVSLDAGEIAPHVTWGTNPEQTAPITGRVPDPAEIDDPMRRAAVERALQYMQLNAEHAARGNSGAARLHRLLHQQPHRGSARRRRDRQGPPGRRRCQGDGRAGLRASSSTRPSRRGSTASSSKPVSNGANPGCSNCMSMNNDRAEHGERIASTSNRNFEGRQGKNAKTHLVGPAMAAAAAVTGHLADVRQWLRRA